MRLNIMTTLDVLKGFNPRICKRCDVHKHESGTSRHCFNPRICKRCDKKFSASFTLVIVSIHASVKDATSDIKTLGFIPNVSIHASVKDATRQPQILATMGKFQSTHL